MSREKINEILKRIFNLEINRPQSSLKGSKLMTIDEAINFEKEMIFIAVSKTGTTSVGTQLGQKGDQLITTLHLNIVQIRDLIYIYLLKNHLGTNVSFSKDNGINGATLGENANKIFDSFFKFSAVKNPWTKAVSLYFRRKGVMLKDKLTFSEFYENHHYASDTCRHPTKHINQLDWLCSEDGQILVDYI